MLQLKVHGLLTLIEALAWDHPTSTDEDTEAQKSVVGILSDVNVTKHEVEREVQGMTQVLGGVPLVAEEEVAL